MKVLVIGAHPDDIEPQMGGPIAKLTNRGHEVLIVLYMDTGGELSDIRIRESINAANILGAKIKHPNIDQDSFIFERKLVKYLDNIISEYKPVLAI